VSSGLQLLAELGRLRNRYSPAAARGKLALLAAVQLLRLRARREVAALHDHLLFLCAFPDDARVRAAAEQGLAALAGRVRRLPARARAGFDDTGLAGSTSRHRFEAPTVRWLVERFGADVEIDWPGLADSSGVEFLLGLLARRAEQDSLESEAVAARAWLRGARGASDRTDLAWLMRQLTRERALAAAWVELYDHVGIPVRWRLRNGAGSTSANRLAVSRVEYRARGLRPPPAHPKRWIATPLATVERLDHQRAAAILDVARAALTARCREVYAISHANLEEVYLADLGAGAALALIGVSPERRLSLESNYGYLLLANGVPIGYGGVTPLYRQANTGINVFEPFRGSEAAFLWVQMLRTFRTLFGVDRFLVNPYQVGAGNSEAIASGAFWFYYRLGFRPVTAALRRLAARERRRQRANPRRRTDAATLRRLASADLELALRGVRAADRFPEPWLERLSFAASEVLGRPGAVSRAADARRITVQVAEALGARDRARWPQAERDAFAALAPLVALLDLESLDARSRQALLKLLRSKGAPQEAPYVRAAARNPVFLPGLATAARRMAVGAKQRTKQGTKQSTKQRTRQRTKQSTRRGTERR
jgi:hypothetical protein